ncbi:major facilitator superfamily protein [Paraburkholderia hospita]|jgi:hypothetical protein|uniref:Major facilitator superfamily protein n=1 Tax=Paraburkholderia hospita TaxID=169430 RepID=A0ABN0F6W7_9BURK|nr:major facilitator superfamily protein [Paraburkholderia hospita]
MVSGWLMTRFGWSDIVAFGIALGLVAAAFHRIGAPRRTSPDDGPPIKGESPLIEPGSR